MPLHVETAQGGFHKICSFMLADNYWILSQSGENLEQMMKELVDEVGRWDTEQENYEYVVDENIRRRGTGKRISIRRQVHTSCFLQRRSRIARGRCRTPWSEIIQNADKAWWRDVKIYGSKDVPWRVTCRRVVDQVHSVFCFESENWCWSQAVTERIRGLGNTIFEKTLREDETVQVFCTRTARTERSIWKKRKLPFLKEIITESTWRALGWAGSKKKNAVLTSLEHVYAWRGTSWCQKPQELHMLVVPNNHTLWKT